MRNAVEIMRDLQTVGAAMNAPLLLEAAQCIASLNAENNILSDRECALTSRVVCLEQMLSTSPYRPSPRQTVPLI